MDRPRESLLDPLFSGGPATPPPPPCRDIPSPDLGSDEEKCRVDAVEELGERDRVVTGATSAMTPAKGAATQFVAKGSAESTLVTRTTRTRTRILTMGEKNNTDLF